MAPSGVTVQASATDPPGLQNSSTASLDVLYLMRECG